MYSMSFASDWTKKNQCRTTKKQLQQKNHLIQGSILKLFKTAYESLILKISFSPFAFHLSSFVFYFPGKNNLKLNDLSYK